MHLEGSGGRVLELSIEGYQFGAIAAEAGGFDFDANWLVVAGRASDGTRDWSFRDPRLLTTEVRGLATWLDAVANEWRDLDPIDFIEPNLEFRRISAPAEPPVVRVAFRLEARPPWAAEAADEDEDGSWLEFEMSKEALDRAVRDLRNELRRYPER